MHNTVWYMDEDTKIITNCVDSNNLIDWNWHLNSKSSEQSNKWEFNGFSDTNFSCLHVSFKSYAFWWKINLVTVLHFNHVYQSTYLICSWWVMCPIDTSSFHTPWQYLNKGMLIKYSVDKKLCQWGVVCCW